MKNKVHGKNNLQNKHRWGQKHKYTPYYGEKKYSLEKIKAVNILYKANTTDHKSWYCMKTEVQKYIPKRLFYKGIKFKGNLSKHFELPFES